MKLTDFRIIQSRQRDGNAAAEAAMALTSEYESRSGEKLEPLKSPIGAGEVRYSHPLRQKNQPVRFNERFLLDKMLDAMLDVLLETSRDVIDIPHSDSVGGSDVREFPRPFKLQRTR